MRYYRDIQVKGTGKNIIKNMNSAFSMVHLALGHGGHIGVSLPKGDGTHLGNVIRLHGSYDDLQDLPLGDGNWGITLIREVPRSCIRYRGFRRVQPKLGASKIRRMLKRGSITKREALALVGDSRWKVDLPFIRLRSNTNKNEYNRYIEFTELSDKPAKGEFDSFGLSKTAMLPWF